MANSPPTNNALEREFDFVVLGEGLAAGSSSFALASDGQRWCFPAQMAARMHVGFVQTLIQPPGIGETPGFPHSSVVLPSPLQSTVVEQMPPDPPSNLSVPGMTVSDAVRRRPCEPLIDRSSQNQTALNLLLGASHIYQGVRGDLPTPLELALARNPKLVVVELGYAEALRAAVSGKAELLPKVESFSKDYSSIITALCRAGAKVIPLTIPDPLDTAYFSTLDGAAQVARIDAALLRELWRLPERARISVPGLVEIGFQILNAATGSAGIAGIVPLPEGSFLTGEKAGELRDGINGLNNVIRSVAAENRCRVFDLHGLFRRIKGIGVRVGHRTLGGGYLEGFYCLNGYYPGATGHALIANELLAWLNRHFGFRCQPVDTAKVMQTDPVAAYRPATGPEWTRQTLSSPPPIPRPAPDAAVEDEALQYRHQSNPEDAIQLPPGLEQVLDLNPDSSYFGDALTAQHCVTPDTIKWGSGYNLLFGGLAMMDSHLSGKVRIRFTPPQNGWTTFQVDFPGGLRGSDATLAAPALFRMPGNLQSVYGASDPISWGRLNLRTGEADAYSGKVALYASLFNTALFALLRVNPKLPKTPIAFPGQYGSAFVKFDQRLDGKLDFTFCGTTFLPLGPDTSFPLSFCGATWEFASIPASGTVLHPHISVTTRAASAPDRARPESEVASPEIPYNTVQEYTLFSPISSFGDLFTLAAPQLGGRALGRSRLIGRLQIQFGPRSGNSVPIATSLSSAGGILAPLNPTPIGDAFPGRLMPGPEGFGTMLRFPLRTYALNDLFVADDMFDISVGALDVATGELIHPLVHRGFINQDVIFSLLRVEPRTRRDSFHFRGPGSLERRPRRQPLFRCFGQIYVPYPRGFLFPDNNLTSGIRTDGVRLDPYLWIWAMQDSHGANAVYSGQGDRILSGKGELFSYRLSIPGNPGHAPAHFVYENHSQGSKFIMHSLSWIGFGSSGTKGNQEFDTVTFSCFGIWKTLHGKDQIVQAAVQLSKSLEAPWFGIQIARAEIGDADTPLPPTTYPVPALGGVVFNPTSGL